jgi:hypothetical protein
MDTMNRRARVGVGSIAAFAVAAGVACGSTSSPPMGGTTPADGEPTAETATLTVMNFLNWCAVTINHGAASTGASMEASVRKGDTATLIAMPASASFMIGADPWFGVTQNGGAVASGADQGTGTSERSTATLVVTDNHCVSVCCQETNNGPNHCPATNPCP